MPWRLFITAGWGINYARFIIDTASSSIAPKTRDCYLIMVNKDKNEHILVINGGSSTIKYALYDLSGLEPVRRENITTSRKDYSSDIKRIISSVFQSYNIVVAGHRIVHGGREYSRHLLISEQVLRALTDLIPLAPLHQPYNLQAVKIIKENYPQIPQIACFDTAFHRTQPQINQLYALPREFSDEGVIRYGFHGLSYEYIASVLPEYFQQQEAQSPARGKVIILHLGSGASACGMINLQSVSTTMGFTALEGLMMATRCGAIDPGVILYLLEQKKIDCSEINNILYKKSGLLGVSGISGDSRDLLANSDPAARQAIDLFCHYALRAIGQLSAELQGLDVIVFTAGIGENQWQIREKIITPLQWLGAKLDIEANIGNKTIISTKDSRIKVMVIPTNEEAVIAQNSAKLYSCL